MRYVNLLLLFVIITSCDSGDQFETEVESHFVKFYGEDGDHEGVDFVVNSDGSFILLGNERVAGSSLGQQIYLVKVDGQGMVVWQRTFGSIGDDFAKDIELTPDNKVIIAAESQKGPNDRDVYIKIIGTDGSPLDSVRFGLKTIDNLESDEEVNSLSLIPGGFIISGSTTAVKTQKSIKPNDTRDAMHLRFTSGLDIVDENTGLWKYTSGLDDSEDVLIKLIQVSTSQYYGFGYTNTIRSNNRDFKYWAFSLGATGDPTNNGTELLDVIGNPLENEKLSGVIESPIQSGEGYILSGIKSSTNDESQSFIVKLQKKLFVPGEDNVLSEESPTVLGVGVGGQSRMTSLAGGGFLLLTDSKVGSNDNLNISLVKLSNTFLKVWQEPIFYGGIGDDFAGTVLELPDGKIVIVGTMTLGGLTGQGQTKMVLIKLNSSGKLSE